MRSLFGTAKHDAYIIIVGCSRLGAELANRFSDENKSVLIVDNNKGAFRKLSAGYTGIALPGDATMIDTLQDARIEKATTLIAVTDSDNTNILVAQLAKELFGVPRVLARLVDPQRADAYAGQGVETICPMSLCVLETDRLMQEDANGQNK